jgi:hypothetical protein
MRRFLKVAAVALIAAAVLELFARSIGYHQGQRVLFFHPSVGTFAGPVRANSEPTNVYDCHLLLIGDSIVDGIDEYTDEIARRVEALSDDSRQCAVTNVSLGGWAPGNALAYFRYFGWPNATHAILVINTDDLNQPSAVRRSWSVSYDAAPSSALIAMLKAEVIRRIEGRYFLPERGDGLGLDDTEILLSDAARNIPSVQVLWHPRLEDVQANATVPDALEHLAQLTGREVIQLPYEPGDFSDRIHLNVAGKEAMVNELADVFLGMISEQR